LLPDGKSVIREPVEVAATLEGAGRTGALLARLGKQSLIFSVIAARPQEN
jgi:hypothetical protein